MVGTSCYRWGRMVVGVLWVLAVLALVAPEAEARFKVNMPKSRSAPSHAKPHIAPSKPEAPKTHAHLDPAAKVPVPGASHAVDNRGFFRRAWDWLLGRKPAPVPTPQTPPQPLPQATAKASAPPPTQNIVVPVAPVRSASAPPSPWDQGKGKDQEQRPLADLNETLRKFSTGTESAGNTRQGTGSAAVSLGQSRPAPQPTGYILHLTNGRSITVPNYEEKGDQVVIYQSRGSYGFHKSAIARIEPQGLEADVTRAGVNRR